MISEGHQVVKFEASLKERKRSRSFTMAKVTIYEIYAFLGVQFLIGYHLLPELPMCWERQSDYGFVFEIFQQVMTRERFKFISKHIACAIPVGLDEKNLRMA